MQLIHQDWLCQVTEDELQRARLHAHQACPSDPRVQEKLWRHFCIKASPSTLLIELTDTAEVRPGLPPPPPSTAASSTSRHYGFSWEDLSDKAFLIRMVEFETFKVGARILFILGRVKAREAALKKSLAPPATPSI